MRKLPDNQLDTAIQRRKFLAGAVAAPIGATALFGASSSSLVAAEASSPQNAIQHSFAIGDFQVSTLLAGTRVVEQPQNIFGMNVEADEFADVSKANFIPTDQSRFYFTPTVVRAGKEVVLFDAGLQAEGTTAALAQAGLKPEDITTVVITHMHGDHIGGLTDDLDEPTFPNAKYVTGRVEYDAWAKMENDGFNAKVKPLAERMQFLEDGQDVISGITSVAAFGHTPGHMCYRLESNGSMLLVAADTANHYVWSLAYPTWEVKFDRDKAAAAATRKNIFGMLAAERMPFIGYHMPFPGVGFVDTRGEGGFHYVPASYQLSL